MLLSTVTTNNERYSYISASSIHRQGPISIFSSQSDPTGATPGSISALSAAAAKRYWESGILAAVKIGGAIVSSQSLRVALAILICVYLAHFIFWSQFGFYEDDWFHIGLAANSRFDFGSAKFLLERPEAVSGRPLGFIITRGLAHWSADTGNILNFYMFGPAITSSYAFVLYLTFKKIISAYWAVMLALLVVVGPFDTTRAFLTHIPFVQTSLLLATLSIYFYSRRLAVIAYVGMAATLLIYEQAFFLALFAPFFRPWKNAKSMSVGVISHLVISGFIIFAVMKYRTIGGEVRATDFAGLSISWATLSELILSWLDVLSATIKTFWHGATTALSPEARSSLFVGFASIAVAFWATRGEKFSNTYTSHTHYRFFGVKVSHSNILIIAAAGVFIVGGVISGTALVILNSVGYDPMAGRFTRFYVVSGFGLSMLIVLVLQSLELWSGKFGSTHITKTIRSVPIILLGLYTTYGVEVQRDNVAGWNFTRSYVQEILRLSPDLRAGRVVVVEGLRGLVSREKQSIAPLGLKLLEGYPYVVENLFDFRGMPRSEQPRIYLATKGWDKHLERKKNSAGCFDWENRVWDGHWVGPSQVCPEMIIHLDASQGAIRRVYDPIVIDGANVIRSNRFDIDTGPALKRGYLYDQFFTGNWRLENNSD